MKILPKNKTVTPIDGFGLSYRFIGESVQSIELSVNPDTGFFSEKGAVCWMTGVKMKIANKGVFSGLARRLSGSSFFLTTFEGGAEGGTVGLTPRRMGPIEAVSLEANDSIICEKRAFLAATSDISLSTVFQKKISAGMLGGDGFVLQKITGAGVVFLSGAGVLDTRLLKAGEEMLVEPGHVSFFEDSVDYSISPVSGLRTMLWGGEGFFFAKLSGPGRIWLQGGGDLNWVGNIKK
jgi:uncharacterized protein (TIGR00266 family)